MTKEVFNELCSQVEESLENQTNSALIISIGRCRNEIMIERNFGYVEILEAYVEYVTPFLHQAVLAEEVYQ